MRKIEQYATAEWQHSPTRIGGSVNTQSDILNNVPYSAMSRFTYDSYGEETNPEELLAAAHAACYSMALSFAINDKGFKTTSLVTSAKVEAEVGANQFIISKITLEVSAIVPGLPENVFIDLAESAKFNCPVSKALATVPIYLTILSFESLTETETL